MRTEASPVCSSLNLPYAIVWLKRQSMYACFSPSLVSLLHAKEKEREKDTSRKLTH